MKKILLLIFLTSCSFEAKKDILDIKYLNVKDLSLGEYNLSLSGNVKKKN